MNYIDILNDKRVIENYQKVDDINPYPFNHGLKHVKNVCKLMDRLCATLGIDGSEKEALLIAAAIHDVGQSDGRKEHGRKAREFVINNYEADLKSNKYYYDILDAIENHSKTGTIGQPLFTLMLQFCDKADFANDRLEDNYRERFRYYCYEDINRVDFIYDETYFGINIISKEIENFKDIYFKEKFPLKTINAIEVLAKKLNRKPILLNNGKEIYSFS